MKTFRAPIFTFAAAVMITTTACDCRGKPPVFKDQCKSVQGGQADRPDPCTSNADCGDHFACATPKDKENVQCCVFQDRACTTEADCCASQTCSSSRKKCFDKFISCESDADCGAKGDRFCETYSDTYGNSSRCRHKPCGALGECAEGQACFNGECLAGLPCEGSCESGKACVPSSDFCQGYTNVTDKDRAPATCPMTCNAGFIATFKDPRNIWDSCVLPDVKCVCAELPGLRSEDTGRFSAMAADPGKNLWVSSYDGQYGDLVVFKYGLDGKRVATEYVDGVPNAVAKYGPSGARGGIVEPGDDVGRYTDIAVSGGRVYVSYYDVTKGDLRVAVRDPAGKWTAHAVDGLTGDVGLYSSIGIDEEGKPVVSYFQRGAEASFDIAACPAPQPTGPKAFVTALKVARSNSTTPTSASDWLVQVVSCQSRPTPPCYACASSDVCADPGTGPDCFQSATSCTGCDANTEICVTAGTMAKCARRYNPSNLNDVVDGVGLFSSLSMNGKDAYVAFMKRVTPPPQGTTRYPPKGDLFGVRVGTSTIGPLVKLDDVGDTGYFPDLKLDPSTKSVAISYHDFSSKKLKFYYAPALQTGVTPETIDTGVGMTAGDNSWVGTDSSLIFGASAGQVMVVYQDPTKGDLKVARRTTAWNVAAPVKSDGAVGFFADGLFTDGKVFASHAKIHARLVSGEVRVDNALLLELVPGN